MVEVRADLTGQFRATRSADKLIECATIASRSLLSQVLTGYKMPVVYLYFDQSQAALLGMGLISYVG